MDPATTIQEKTHHPDKTLGYILLSIGLLMITAVLVWVFLTFTGKITVTKVLNVEAPSIPLPTAGISLDESALPPQIANSIKQNQQPQSIKLIPDEVFSSLVNMIVFYLLAMFIASTGAKIASIGVSLIKDPKS